ncbi:hypothetical protein KCU81_g2488, partial [Aureobasidium melanogenum]|uniref:Uncharacterized protein n=1 Tax=Aureobasidium melanogenum (strain CBS 110374) TaxID=1043003 RepID=A0A074WSN4_AURM1
MHITDQSIQEIDKSASPASMHECEDRSSMRVTRLAYQSHNAPFGLWTLPNPVDGPTSAPCYMPYGEPSPPNNSSSTPGLTTGDQTTVPKLIETDVLKPWEKGSKSGKKIKRGPRVRGGMNLASDVVSSDGSFKNSSSFSNNVPSTATTSTQPSSQNLPASYTGWYPALDVAQYTGCPGGLVLPRPATHHIIHPDTAQAAIASSRKRKHDPLEIEASAQSAKMHRRE